MAKSLGDRRDTVEELHFRSHNAFLCLLLNRRTKVIRVIDFRAGAVPAKRLFIQNVAAREGMEKVVALVEKDEVGAWTKVGFQREGTIPGFYKRSDGHLLGWLVGGVKGTDTATRTKAVEKTINAAKKLQKAGGRRVAVSVKDVAADIALEARDAAWRKTPAIAPFDAFGRGVRREYFSCTPRGGEPNYVSCEIEDCFSHAMLEVLRRPENDAERQAISEGLSYVSESLLLRNIVSGFAFAPASDIELSAAFLDAGFRKTGILSKGTLNAEQREDTIVWTRKLANPDREQMAG